MQREILSLVQEGWSDKEIAEKLHYAEVTIRKKVAALKVHFGARNRTELACKTWRTQPESS
ncbi:response regulator transcription factor [Corynebacterium sp.]|uniref:response regulator transcription factor n=1 Tax=Corynebacterium sp. TaxID=1720 RepID=UPI0034C5E989